MSTNESTPLHGTTVISVRKDGQVVIAADGQVSFGDTVLKANARKTRILGNGKVIAGFAGATADAFTLFERLEARLDQYPGQLTRACVELAKDWRTDRYLRKLEAMMIVADKEVSLVLTGTGDVLEPEDGLIGIGSGGTYALAAARALAELAREDVPDEVDEAYAGTHLRYGPDYLIPAPFDPRLITAVPRAVAQAAMNSGVARRPIIDMDAYEAELSARLNPTAGSLHGIFEELRKNPKRVVFAEGEEEKSIRAAYAFLNGGFGTPILIGREERVRSTMDQLGLPASAAIEIVNSKLSPSTADYINLLYERLQRRGYLERDCVRMVNRDRNVFGALMVQSGDADALVTGLTRNYHMALDQITRVLDPAAGSHVFGLSMVMTQGKTLFVAGTAIHEVLSPEQMADIAQQAAAVARGLGHEPRVALISYSNFGHPDLPRAQPVRDAVKVLDERHVGFEYEGEMTVEVALNTEVMANYPFCRLTGPANVLIMPSLHTSQVSTQLLKSLGGGTVLGPVLIGLSKPVQIVPMGTTVSDMVNMAALAAQAAD